MAQTVTILYRWLGSLVVMAWDSQPDGLQFNYPPPWLVLVWGTIFGWANHLSISLSHTGQLGLLPLVGWEMITSQSAVMLCGRGVKAGWLIPLVNKLVGGR